MAQSVNITVHTDSAAGKSMATRFGISKKTKHVELRFLYVQELEAKGILRLRKVGTEVHCADVLTKYLSSELLVSHLRKLCVFILLIISNCSTARWLWTVEIQPLSTGGEVARTAHTHTYCIDIDIYIYTYCII